MRYYRIERGERTSLLAENGTTAYDLTATEPAPTSFLELASAASLTGGTVDDVASRLVEDAPTVDIDAVRGDLVRPLDPEEVWGAGVTYAIS